MKKLISLICAFCVLSGVFGGASVLADAGFDVLVNEVFDDIATNGAPETAAVKSGLDARVVDISKTNKALYARAEGCAVKINVPIEKTYPQMVFSCRVMLKGAPVKGDVMLPSGSSAASPLLNYDGRGEVLLEDGMRVDGYSAGRWKEYAAAVNFEARCYDLYIDGVKKVSNRRFYSTPVKPKSLNFNFTCLQEQDTAECFIDNIRVYEGNKPLSNRSFPSKGYNPKVLDFDPAAAEEQVYDTIFIDSNSQQGIGKISFVQKENTRAGWDTMRGDELPYIHFIKSGTNDTYANVTPDLYDGLAKFVWQTDVYLVANPSGTVNVGTAMNGSTYSQLLQINTAGNLVVGSTVVGKMDYKKWVTLAVACNMMNETVAVYKDGKLLVENIPMPNDSVNTQFIRIGFGSSSALGENEVYFNRIKMYDGLTLRTFDDSGSVATGNDAMLLDRMKATRNETDADAQKLLGTDVAFMTANGMFYAKGEKRAYKGIGADSYLDGDTVMVDVKVLSYALNVDCKMENGSAVIKGKAYAATEKDSSYFVDAASVGRGLSKYAYDTDNRGFLLLSDTARNYTNEQVSVENQEPIDVIWRYLQFDRPSGTELYEALKNGGQYQSHPRLFVKKDEVAQLRRRISNDANLRNILGSVIQYCESKWDTLQDREVQSDGFRIFPCCDEVKERLYAMCTVYLLTGDTKYAERAWLEIENACNWTDWNTSVHFLDSGEIGPGIAFAYDVLYDYLTAEQKSFIRKKVTEQYLDYCVGVFTGASNYNPTTYKNWGCNWGAVTGTSMLMVALTFMDEEPEDSMLTQKCKYIVSNAMQTYEHIVTALAPEGVWHEGTQYNEYVWQHMAWFLESLDNVLGNDYGFLSAQGVREYTEFMMYYHTRAGSFNKGNSNDNRKSFPPEAMIYARLYDEPERMGLYDDFRKSIGVNSYLPQYLLFYDPEYAVRASDNPLPPDRYFDTVGTGVIRDSWTDTEGLYLAVSGGKTDEHYGDAHLDKGSFTFESMGERWSIDLGRNGNDVMPYLYRAETHSTLVINPTVEYGGQLVEQAVGAVEVESKPRGAKMIYDLTNVYNDTVSKYQRGFLVSDDRNTLTVQDELTLKARSNLVWNMVTRADIEIAADGKSAILTLNGKKMKVTADCSVSDWRLEQTADMAPTGGWVDNVPSVQTESHTYSVTEQKAFAAQARKLLIKTSASGNVTIAVKLAPIKEGEAFADVQMMPMSAWTLPGGEISRAQADAIYADGDLLDGFMPGIKEYTMTCPYGSAVPQFTAEAAQGRVEISQPASFMDKAIVTVTLDSGRKAVYTIRFAVTERITDALMDTVPEPALPGNVKFLDIAGVIASDEPQPLNAAINVADGDLSTRWSSDVLGAYVEVDLGAVYDLSGIALAYHQGASRNYLYDILVSEDKMDYRRIYTGQSTGKTDDYEFLETPVKARYVRYVGYQHKDGIWNSVTEIRPAVTR